MDPILMQKFEAIKKSKKSKKLQLLDKLFQYTLVAFTCSLFFSSLFASIKDFLFIFLPKISSILCSPKVLFFVGNLIVVVLIGESKFFASASGDVYYDEYVNQSRSLRKSSAMEVKKMKPFEEGVKREVKKGKNEHVLPTEELKKRADDFIAKVNRQRRLEATLLPN
ncbi:hypothetical protein PTKIN_Ptkin05aG0203900 [Pterospermum kingtungense]